MKITKSLVVIAFALIAIGGTVAYYSYEMTTDNSAFVMGDLLLEIDGVATTFPFTVSNAKPCDGAVGRVGLKNIGSVDGELEFVRINKTGDTENICNVAETAAGDTSCGNPGDGNGELDDYLFITLWDDVNNDSIIDPSETVFFSDTLSNLDNAVYIPSPAIPINAGATKNLKVRWDADKYCWDATSSAGNLIQTDGASFTITFALKQA